jgi:glutaredoxin
MSGGRAVGALRLALLLAAMAAVMVIDAAAAGVRQVEVFVSEGCPHCAAAQAFVDQLASERSDVEVTITDIRSAPGALGRLQELSRQSGIAQPGVPTIRIGDALIVGFDSPATTGARVRNLLDAAAPEKAAAIAASGEAGASCPQDSQLSCQAPPSEAVTLPFSDRRISVDDVGLPLFTLMIGALDGFNPCSMWVLILMLSLLASLRDRRRMLAIAGTFVAIQGIVYFAFMAAWLNLFLLIGLSRPSEIAIGILALVAGAINLKDFALPGRGVSLSIPAAAKPGIYQRLRAILQAERLWPAVAGAVVLALLVQVVELLCTSGFPALYTRILTLRELDRAAYYGYLLLYIAMYMLDDVVVLGIGIVTLSERRLQEREGRLLKLVAGLAMIGLGAFLLAPR